MPASSFTPSPGFDWPPAPRRRARPKKRKRKPPRVLTAQVRTVLIDRIEAAIAAGLVDLLADGGPTPELQITTGELALLLSILFPEDYPAPRRRAVATTTAPGSEARIAAYAARVAANQSLFAPGDATAHRAHDRGLAITPRGNGVGVKVVGWEGE